MNDVAIIFQAEFLRKIRSRPFIIGTIIGALAIVALALAPSVLSNAFNNSTKKIVLSGAPAIVSSARTILASDYDIVAVIPELTDAPTVADLDAYKKAAAIVVLVRRGKELAITAYARDPATFDASLGRKLLPLNIAMATNLPLSRIKPYLTVHVDVRSLDAKFTDQKSADVARGIASILVLLLYLAIMLNSQTVMASVAEEKTSRVAELLVATTSPSRLLAGKILAAGLAGIIQLTVWISAGLATGAGIVASFSDGAPRGSAGALGAGAIDITTGEIAAFVIFFVIGFMQFATLYAAAASLINRTEDLGSVAAPLVLPVVGGYILAQYALAFPNSPNVAIFSQIPLIAPFVMFTRMTVASVPTWQIILSIGINISATLLIVWAAGRVYRVGLLLYGRPPSIKQVILALRA